ncbi:MAG: tRNA uridine-5-carboxymethylaminomethyl(34) synthesis GTPase MnmE [Aquamicrobium sp.]|uniref:tRNA uridine-5-carboxymethylaminomethyl(34) synthesis GTPase MnmE n=1 Tax=Mesorhizobium sp. Pch-S TaxID=2082387 RepID=UPI0010108D23|nr:tRNA uridine-5-carboxymethylaminomethyl(34) synthesis GTPase MnmE [Mesorhizobium sp. Pch-S]MBR2689038.1 tRNA uridine-5-carboxymethylaminomethyl(34) synthesis GTPase MnmE [Aquamicrobium sp.]QAZ43519.1 tRNA uridine-5-carboxymethylaminomethyl(34) synthesis GTPase MnmE [Mesorhizobium sp. Pch-S]
MRFSDSIVALSSGKLPAGVAVVRLSGSRTRFALETILGASVPEREVMLRRLKQSDGSLIDTGLVIFFPGPASFTGEDVAEFQVHGGKAVVSALLRTLTAIDGIRHAEPGEFTRRAFLNGKLDLVETEALADLINAETESQRRFALLNASGAQSELYDGWRRRLIHARAMIEAEIDFADEDDIPGSVSDTIWSDMRKLSNEITGHVSGFHAGEIIREGFDVVILGAPNAGKSSLFNALARREAAIVSDEPGTTRDLLEVVLDLHGLKVRLTDTAGLREQAGTIEGIGIQRARNRAQSADLIVALQDVTVAPADIELPSGPRLLRVGTKVDLLAAETKAEDAFDLVVSAKTGAGLDQLLETLGELADGASGAAGSLLPTRLRHVELLEEGRAFIERTLVQTDLELQAEDLRLAGERLGRIVGIVDVEDLLDVIFSQFCIGK